MKAVRFDPDAIEELSEAARWYEDRREGLGVELIECVDEAVVAAAEGRPQCRAAYGLPPELRVLRVLVRRFPYLVYFVDLGESIRVIAVAHERRRTGYWIRRLTR